MTLEVFSRDWVPILQLGVMALGLISLFLVWWQIRQTRIWNKLISQQNYLDMNVVTLLEREILKDLKNIGIDVHKLGGPLDDESVEKIFSNVDAYISTKAYLSQFESLGAALEIGVSDPDLAYAIHSSRLIRAYKIFEPFIEKLKNKHNDQGIYLELKKTALKWCKQRNETEQASKRKTESLNEQALKQSGAQSKV